MSANPSIFIHAEHVHLNSSAPVPRIDVSTIDCVGATIHREYRQLGGGEKIPPAQALSELAALGDDWRLETPHELFALVDYNHKNAHGAYTRDPTLQAGYYWTNQPTPWYEGGRVVVGFGYGFVGSGYDGGRAFARAVRVSGQ